MKLIILINCPDQPGIIHSTTGFIANLEGNVVYLDQHVDKQAEVFFMRLECEFQKELDLSLFKDNFAKQVASQYHMQWNVYTDIEKPYQMYYLDMINQFEKYPEKFKLEASPKIPDGSPIGSDACGF